MYWWPDATQILTETSNHPTKATSFGTCFKISEHVSPYNQTLNPHTPHMGLHDGSEHFIYWDIGSQDLEV